MSVIQTFQVKGGVEDISFVPIEQIELDIVMVNTLRKLNPDINLDNFIQKTRSDLAGSFLQRVETMIEGIANDVEFPPVDVLIHESGGGLSYVPPSALKRGVVPREIPKVISYSILNGRHRVVASILNNYTHVPVLISKTQEY